MLSAMVVLQLSFSTSQFMNCDHGFFIYWELCYIVHRENNCFENMLRPDVELCLQCGESYPL